MHVYVYTENVFLNIYRVLYIYLLLLYLYHLGHPGHGHYFFES